MLDDEPKPAKKDVVKEIIIEEDKKNVDEFIKNKGKVDVEENINNNFLQKEVDRNYDQALEGKINLNAPSFGSKGANKGQANVGIGNLKNSKVF